MLSNGSQFQRKHKGKMRNPEVSIRAAWDALNSEPFPREYDSWEEIDQRNYERVRLQVVNIITHAGSCPAVENARAKGYYSPIWLKAREDAERQSGASYPSTLL